MIEKPKSDTGSNSPNKTGGTNMMGGGITTGGGNASPGMPSPGASPPGGKQHLNLFHFQWSLTNILRKA